MRGNENMTNTKKKYVNPAKAGMVFNQTCEFIRATKRYSDHPTICSFDASNPSERKFFKKLFAELFTLSEECAEVASRVPESTTDSRPVPGSKFDKDFVNDMIKLTKEGRI
jgi:hypothetical protein